MKTLVNKANPEIRVTAPEIRVGSDSYYLLTDKHYGFIFRKIRWTLVEEEETIVKTIKEFVEKGERCMQQAVEDQDQGNYTFWDGFHNCAEGILREVEEPTEGIKGNLEGIPSNVDLEKEMNSFIEAEFSLSSSPELMDDTYSWNDIKATIRVAAKHFYELGRKGGSK